jgi:hypothetical protein
VHTCFAVWSNASSGIDDGYKEHAHKSGLDVKMMGCFTTTEDCSVKDHCTADSDKLPARGHLFCCCLGSSKTQHNMYFQRFYYVVSII